VTDKGSALEHLLDTLLDRYGEKALFIMLGSGDQNLEQFFTEVAGRYANFLFIKGYSEELSNHLYRIGDLFLMPSSFEPCGISQMLAMREGQPCLVHAVGGLGDTVKNNIDGFHFDGETLDEQAKNFVARFIDVFTMKTEQPEQWQHISQTAKAVRFTWKKVAQDYQTHLYPALICSKDIQAKPKQTNNTKKQPS